MLHKCRCLETYWKALLAFCTIKNKHDGELGRNCYGCTKPFSWGFLSRTPCHVNYSPSACSNESTKFSFQTWRHFVIKCVRLAGEIPHLNRILILAENKIFKVSCPKLHRGAQEAEIGPKIQITKCPEWWCLTQAVKLKPFLSSLLLPLPRSIRLGWGWGWGEKIIIWKYILFLNLTPPYKIF